MCVCVCVCVCVRVRWYVCVYVYVCVCMNKPIAQSLFGMHDVITQVVVKGARALSRVKRQPRLVFYQILFSGLPVV